MSGPRVSVVVLAYNHAPYIGQTLDSIFAQQFDGELEVIVTEDASTDRTRAIIETYLAQHPHGMRMIARDSNVGGKQNILDGFAAATGEYIAVLDGDDHWEDPQKLALQLGLLQQHPDYAGCGHNTRMHYVLGNRPDSEIVPPSRKREAYTLRDFIQGRIYLHSSALLFRNYFMGGLPIAHHDVQVGDSFMCMLFAERGPIGFIDRTMSVYRYTGKGIWSSIPPLEQRMATLESLIVGNEKMGYRHAAHFDWALVRYSASLGFATLIRAPWKITLLLRTAALMIGHLPGMLGVPLKRWSRAVDRFVLAGSTTPREPLPRTGA